MTKHRPAQTRKAKQSLGAWLVRNAPKGAPITKAPRASKRGDPFAPAKQRIRKRRSVQPD